jgi:hypothetical protein
MRVTDSLSQYGATMWTWKLQSVTACLDTAKPRHGPRSILSERGVHFRITLKESAILS